MRAQREARQAAGLPRGCGRRQHLRDGPAQPPRVEPPGRPEVLAQVTPALLPLPAGRAPRAALALEKREPAFAEQPPVVFLALFAPRRGADVVIDHAAVRHVMPVAPLPGAQAEIRVLRPVAKRLVEPAQREENPAPDHAARRRHRRPFEVGLARRRGRVLGGVAHLAVQVEIHPGVVDQPADGFPLNVAHARRVGQPPREARHRLQEAGPQDGVVVEQAEQPRAGEARAVVVVRREPARGVVEHRAHARVFGCQRAQKFPRAVGAAVVDKDPLVRPPGQRPPGALDASPGQFQPVEQRGDERDLHAGTRSRRRTPV